MVLTQRWIPLPEKLKNTYNFEITNHKYDAVLKKHMWQPSGDIWFMKQFKWIVIIKLVKFPEENTIIALRSDY